MLKKFYCIVFIVLISCETGEDRIVNGVIKEVRYNHLGKGNYTLEVTYNYTFEAKEYESKEAFNYKWQGDYNKGDSIKIKFNSLSPDESIILQKKTQQKKKKSIKVKSK